MEGKTTPLVIRIDPDLKKAFELIAKESDLTVSQMLRKYIRYEVDTYSRKHAQKPLFSAVAPTKPKSDAKVSTKPVKPVTASKTALLGMFKGK